MRVRKGKGNAVVYRPESPGVVSTEIDITAIV